MDRQLSDPVGVPLSGKHSALAVRRGRTARHESAFSSFWNVPDDPQPGDWDDLAGLLGPGALANLVSNPAVPPEDWRPMSSTDGVLMRAQGFLDATAARFGCELVVLGSADASEMLDLVAQNSRAPSGPRRQSGGRSSPCVSGDGWLPSRASGSRRRDGQRSVPFARRPTCVDEGAPDFSFGHCRAESGQPKVSRARTWRRTTRRPSPCLSDLDSMFTAMPA